MWTEQSCWQISELEDGGHRIDSSARLKAPQLQFSKKLPGKEPEDGAWTLPAGARARHDLSAYAESTFSTAYEAPQGGGSHLQSEI